MRVLQATLGLFNRNHLARQLKKFNHHVFSLNNKCPISTSTAMPSKFRAPPIDHNSDSDIEPDIDLGDTYKINSFTQKTNVRNLMFENSKDELIQRLKNCCSIQEVFNIFNCHTNEFHAQHLLQAILVLCDLKNIFHNLNSSFSTNDEELDQKFIQQLNSSDTFQKLLKLIKSKSNQFNLEHLSWIVLYLNRLGLNCGSSQLLESLLEKLERKLVEEKFEIGAAAKYLETIYNDLQLRSFYMSQKLIPLVLDELNSCDSKSKLNDLTLSLNKLHSFVSNENLAKFKNLTKTFIQTNKIDYHDYKLILNLLAFLNYPNWRLENSLLMTEIILMLKGHLHLLDVYELTLLYDIVFRLQEPGEILSELQRCASRYLQQLDDVMLPQKISLFSSLVFFTSPQMRHQFQKSLQKYVHQCDNIENLIMLRRILSYVKINDHKLCKEYFDKILRLIENDVDSPYLIKLATNYVNFSLDIPNFRHLKFEQVLSRLLERQVEEKVEIAYFPHKFVNIVCFTLNFDGNLQFLERLVNKLEGNWQQLNAVSALKLSMGLKLFESLEKKYDKLPYSDRISRLISKMLNNEIQTESIHSTQQYRNSIVLKALIFRSNFNTKYVDNLLQSYSESILTSKTIENICYNFMATNTLVPEVMKKIEVYLIENKENLLGFNVEKILYLFYSLGYCPQQEEFFETATNIIIRDQQRIGGLSLLHCAIALCYFHKLPNYLIKAIFNVEFLDKLDTELENCYSKDKYPQRVRNNLMQLNRAVCLDYPESNVPWFHKKYIEELSSLRAETNNRNKLFPARVKEYLKQTINDANCIYQNVITPYGYQVDFVLYLNDKDQIVEENDGFNRKLAFLLLPQYCYTRIHQQLRGKIQMKKRHLEILGYKVVIVNFSDWISLFYADERIDYLSRLIWPKIKVYR